MIYAQSDTLLFADEKFEYLNNLNIFENLRNKSIEMYDLDPENCLSSPGLA